MQSMVRSRAQRVVQQLERHRRNRPTSLSNRGEVLRLRNRGSQRNNSARCLQVMRRCC